MEDIALYYPYKTTLIKDPRPPPAMDLWRWNESRIDLEYQLSDFRNILVMSFHGVQWKTLRHIIRAIQPGSRCYHCPRKGAIKALRNHARETRDQTRLELIERLRGQVFLILTNSPCQDILDKIQEVEVDGSPKAHIKPRLKVRYENGWVPKYIVPM